MDKKYVIKGAQLTCQYGCHICLLKPCSHRHIAVDQRELANEGDMQTENFYGDFGMCRSPYVTGLELSVRDVLDNNQQLEAYGIGNDCHIRTCIPWQSAKSDVYFGSNRIKALLEDSWNICYRGFGIISVVDSGQEKEDPVHTVLERLQELQNIVDRYMKENGIKERERENLLESILLWNGYRNEDIPWEYESSETNRAFCTYLERENSSLFNYFERGIYLADNEGEIIDVTYMLGINKALNGTRDKWECVNQGITQERGMYNGYMEACRQERGRSTSEMLEDFLMQISASDYNGGSRYSAYCAELDDRERSQYCSLNGIDPQSLSVQEKDRGLLFNMITGRIQEKVYSDKGGLDERINDQTERAKEIVNLFLNQLEADVAAYGGGS